MLTVGSMFSGVGLLDYGLHQAGLRHEWFCERDEFRRGILTRRWSGARVLDDVRTVGAHTVPGVDIIAGGFPCKGASTAGKRTGFDHPETVLWREMARAVGELRPRYVLVENVANILVLHDGAVWGEVLGTLAALGFDVVWDCLPAAAVGAPHLRDRVIAVAAYAQGVGTRESADRTDAIAAGGDARQVVAGGGGVAAPDPGRDGLRQQSEPERTAAPSSLASRAGEAASDAGGGRQQKQPQCNGADAGSGQLVHAGDDVERRGVRVDWGVYGPAIRRWEAIHGSAPEPLVRRVDDRGAARVERSRLSALGDGVQCQVGRIAGEYIAGLERERLMGLAA